MKQLLCMIVSLSLFSCGEDRKEDDPLPHPIVGFWVFDESQTSGYFMTFSADGSCIAGVGASEAAFSSTIYIQLSTCSYVVTDDLVSFTWLTSSKPDKAKSNDFKFTVNDASLRFLSSSGVTVFTRHEADPSKAQSVQFIYGYFDDDGKFTLHDIVDL